MTLRVHTARYRYAGMDRLDVTRSGVERHRRAMPGVVAPGAPFAPPRWLLNVAKGYSRWVPEGVEAPPVEPGELWAWYDRWYTRAMRWSWRRYAGAWEALLGRAEVTLVCFCAEPSVCHRGLLAGLLGCAGAVVVGERSLPPVRARR